MTLDARQRLQERWDACQFIAFNWPIACF